MLFEHWACLILMWIFLWFQRIDSQLAALQMATENFKKVKNDFAAQLTDEQVKLIRFQVSGLAVTSIFAKVI